MVDQEVLNLIPQRAPFLFVDKIISRNNQEIICEKLLTGKEDFFKGHFPANPIMPGVLLQECCFQAGALLMATGQSTGLGVVTRVDKAKFKNFAHPQDKLTIEVKLKEQLSNAYFMSGKVKVAGKVIMLIDFACALVEGNKS